MDVPAAAVQPAQAPPPPPAAAALAATFAHRASAAAALTRVLRGEALLGGVVFVTAADLGVHLRSPAALELRARGAYVLGASLGRLLSLPAREGGGGGGPAAVASLRVPLLRGAAQTMLEYEHWATGVGLLRATAVEAAAALMGSAATAGSELLASLTGGGGGGGDDGDADDGGDGHYPCSLVPATAAEPPRADGPAHAPPAKLTAASLAPRLHRVASGGGVAYEALLVGPLLLVAHAPYGPCLGYVEATTALLGVVAGLYRLLAQLVGAPLPPPADDSDGGGALGAATAPLPPLPWSAPLGDALARLDRRLKHCVLKPLALELEAAGLGKLGAGFGGELAAAAAAVVVPGTPTPARSATTPSPVAAAGDATN